MLRDRSDRIAANPPFRGYGAAVTPGRDGPVAFVAGYGEANRLLQRDGAALADVACGVVADPSRHGLGVVAADVDADGREEVYVHNTESYGGRCEDGDLLLDKVRYPRGEGWADAFALRVNADRGNYFAGRSVAALDRYGTGRYGLAVAGYGSDTRFFELGDDGEVTDMAEAVGLDFTTDARSLLAGPIVSDRMDLLVGVDGGSNRLFRNNNGHYVDVAGDVGVTDPMCNARGVAFVDEGTDELAVACGNWEGPTRLFRREGDRFRDVAPESLSAAERVRTLVAADFDNDGRQELFVNCLGGENRLLVREGAEWRAVDPGAAAEPTGLGTGAAVADFDGDGTLELLVVHGELDAQPLSLYAAPNGGDWLRVRPTTQYGAPARGAVVVLETDAGTQRRVVDAGSGYLCQSEPVAHFGLGDARPERVVVRWPDGRETAVDDPRPRTEREVAHPLAPRF